MPWVSARTRRARLEDATDTDPVAQVPMRPAVGIVTAQLVGAAGYAAFIASGDAPETFSIEDWVWILLPPLSFSVLLFMGLVLAGAVWGSGWRWRLASGLCCVVSGCGLLVTLGLVPILLFGSFMDWTIG